MSLIQIFSNVTDTNMHSTQETVLKDQFKLFGRPHRHIFYEYILLILSKPFLNASNSDQLIANE